MDLVQDFLAVDPIFVLEFDHDVVSLVAGRVVARGVRDRLDRHVGVVRGGRAVACRLAAVRAGAPGPSCAAVAGSRRRIGLRRARKIVVAVGLVGLLDLPLDLALGVSSCLPGLPSSFQFSPVVHAKMA